MGCQNSRYEFSRRSVILIPLQFFYFWTEVIQISIPYTHTETLHSVIHTHETPTFYTGPLHL